MLARCTLNLAWLGALYLPLGCSERAPQAEAPSAVTSSSGSSASNPQSSAPGTSTAPASSPGSSQAATSASPSTGATSTPNASATSSGPPSDTPAGTASAPPSSMMPGSAAPSTMPDAGEPTEPVPGVDEATAARVEMLRTEFAAYWDFESATAQSAPDRSGQHPLSVDGAQFDSAAFGRFLTTSGASQTATYPDALIDSSKDFSVSAWVRLDQIGDYATFMGLDGEQVSAFYVQKRSDDRLSFTTFPADGTDASPCVATAEIQPRGGEWYHVVGTRAAASRQQRIYVDGVLSGSITCPEGVFRANGALTLGRGLYSAEPSDSFTGALDDVGIIGRVLGAEEVFDLYHVGRPNAEHYLFAYFVERSQGRGDGLRLAQSHDGLHWGAIGAGKVFMPPSVGGGSFRDPHVMRGPDGVYHLVWTTSCVPWAESNCVQDRGLGHATSADLVQWSAADYITVDLNVEHVWAPETYFDSETQQYMIFWSSPIDQDPAASDPHDIYYVLTKDFRTFTEPAVLYSQPGRNFIDATIKADGDGYLMVLKDEANGQKNLRALRSAKLFGEGAWTAAVSNSITGNYGAEGPSLLERGGELYVYFDKYDEGAYGALRASANATLDSPAAWTDISSTVFFPGVRHGTPIAVGWDVYRSVALAAATP